MDRENNVKKISELLEKNIARKIEESVHSFAVAYTKETEMPFLLESIYSDKFIEIFNLLVNKKSKFLINALELGKIDPTKIAYMRPDELNPDKYEKIIQKKEIEDFKKKNVATSSAYKCPKCGERKISITQKQTRSADEPATIYMECNVCGYVTIDDGS
jgi:DNA-directed RNA polymerase subunit M/transcription elongation factor TFIIS